MDLTEQIKLAIAQAQNKELSVDEFTAKAIELEGKVNEEVVKYHSLGQKNYPMILSNLFNVFISLKPDGMEVKIVEGVREQPTILSAESTAPIEQTRHEEVPHRILPSRIQNRVAVQN